MFKRSDWTDQDVEAIIANLLRVGVIISASMVLIGGLMFLALHGFGPANYRVFKGEPTDLRQFHGIIRATLALHGRGIIQLGLLFLIATPVARVAFAAFAFSIERDWLYVGISTFVLLVLLYSLLGSAI
jgi:uncharacterized membrane protein